MLHAIHSLRSYGLPAWLIGTSAQPWRSVEARRARRVSCLDADELVETRAKAFAELRSEIAKTTGLRCCPQHWIWTLDDEACPACVGPAREGAGR